MRLVSDDDIKVWLKLVMNLHKVSVSLVEAPDRTISFKTLNLHLKLNEVTKVGMDPLVNLDSKMWPWGREDILNLLCEVRLGRHDRHVSSRHFSLCVFLNIVLFYTDISDVDVKANVLRSKLIV